jgi:hypothetical protein
MSIRRADDSRHGPERDPQAAAGDARVRRAAARLLAGTAALAEGGVSLLGDARRVCSFLRGRLEFRPRPDDVYVVSYPRSGTTWMQLMLHRLAGRDDLDFTHISEVSPWFERSLAIGTMTAADFETFPAPRIMKSHLPYGWLPRPARYIYLWRDGRDVAVSYYHFYRSHLGYRDDFASFFQRFLRGELQYRSWFDHVAGWTARPATRDVLVVRYEEMLAGRSAVLRRVAAHLNLAVSEARLARVVTETSFEAMKAQEAKFDHATALLLERGYAGGTFLRRGRVGEGEHALDAGQQTAFAEHLGPATALPTRALHLAAFLH